MSAEEWRPIPDANGHEVSNLGRVRNRQGRILKPVADRDGYLRVSFLAPSTFVHRLVIAAFGPPQPAGKGEVCHNDGDPANNTATNLRWGDRSDQALDMVRHGTHNYARRTHCSKGHEYTPGNTYIEHKRGGQKRRRCRQCRRAEANRRYARAREAA